MASLYVSCRTEVDYPRGQLTGAASLGPEVAHARYRAQGTDGKRSTIADLFAANDTRDLMRRRARDLLRRGRDLIEELGRHCAWARSNGHSRCEPACSAGALVPPNPCSEDVQMARQGLPLPVTRSDAKYEDGACFMPGTLRAAHRRASQMRGCTPGLGFAARQQCPAGQ
jgi:hypothetical protein